jgi:hypothetical protein
VELKHILLFVAIIIYLNIVYLFSKLGKTREIGSIRLFIVSFLLTPVIGLAFLISSNKRKLNIYKEKSYKCNRCGFVFSENHIYCPFCEKEGHFLKLTETHKIMT